MKISVIIVNYNVRYYLEQCLLSLRKALADIPSEVFVVDNHSRDGSVEYLRRRFREVTFVASTHNLGFARANNFAIRKAQGGVKMLKCDGDKAMESRRGLPSPLTAFYKMCGLCGRYPQSRRFGKYYMSYLSWDEPVQIEVISGAYCLLRHTAIDKIGMLDEDFFMYGEDIDLSYRLLKGGFENWYLPVSILHYKGESTHKSSFRYVHVFYEAMLIFFRKHYRHLSFWISLPIRLAIYVKATIALVQMLLGKSAHSMGFFSVKRKKEPEYLFLCSGKNLSSCRRLADNRGLTARFVECSVVDREKGHEAYLDRLSSDTVTYVVYDISLFSYGDILRAFEGNPRKNVLIGTFNPRNHILITDQEVLR